MVGNPTQAACVVSALTEPKPECSQSQPRSHTGSLQIPQRARCQATPLRSVREMCLLLTSPYIEPAQFLHSFLSPGFPLAFYADDLAQGVYYVHKIALRFHHGVDGLVCHRSFIHDVRV